MISHSLHLPYGDKEQNRKGNTKGILQGFVCTKSIRGSFNHVKLTTGTKEIRKDVSTLHRNATNGTCVLLSLKQDTGLTSAAGTSLLHAGPEHLEKNH